jgi:hypothetical protein
MSSEMKTAELSLGDRRWEFSVRSGTDGPDVMDIGSLYEKTGMFTFDPGFTSTASCESRITFIDGEKGILRYRGYPIDELVAKRSYLDVCYLLLNGELPDATQSSDFEHRIIHHTMVHEQMAHFFRGFRRDAHPMAIMTAGVGALSAFYHDSTDINDPHQRMVASMRMIAKVPTLAAMAYKYSTGQPFIYPKNDLDYSANFLRMWRGSGSAGEGRRRRALLMRNRFVTGQRINSMGHRSYRPRSSEPSSRPARSPDRQRTYPAASTSPWSRALGGVGSLGRSQPVVQQRPGWPRRGMPSS